MHWTSAPPAWTAVAILLFNFSSITVAQTALNVIDISRDGQSCPEGTEPSASYGGICSYGSYVSNRIVLGKCCFHPTQLVFLQSVAGGENHLKAAYKLDSQSCCSPGEEGTALIADQCVYGTNSLVVPTDTVTKCCWNTTIEDFSVHLTEVQPLLTLSDINVEKDGQAPNSFCNLGYKAAVQNARIYGNRVELDISVNVDCATYNDTSSTTLTIYLTSDYTASGRLTYVLSWVGPTVYVDISTRINPSHSMDIHGRITGTGVLGRLEEGFTTTVDNDYIKAAISSLTTC